MLPNWSPTSDFLLDRVIAQCEAHGIGYVDVRTAFAPYKQEEQKLWVNRLDAHPGPLANSLVADQVMDTFAPQWLEKTEVQTFTHR